MITFRGAARLALLVGSLAGCGDNIHIVDDLLVSPTEGLHTTEAGGTATFTVQLTSTPGDDMTVSLASSNVHEGTVAPATLTFNSATFDMPQTVTITGIDDHVIDGAQPYTIQLTSEGVPDASVDVTNDDNDAAGVAVTPTSGLMTTESGGQATFTVALNAQPTADVVLPLATSDDTEGTVDLASLVFTADDWNAPQTVTITGVDDSIVDGNIDYMIELSPMQSSDPGFDGVDPPDVAVTNIDNDTAGFIVTPTSGLRTTEAGGTDMFTVVLTAQPVADVTVALSSSDTTEATVTPTSLTFTAQNWNAPQTVTAHGVDDAIHDGDQPFTIQTAPAVSTDVEYSGIDPADVTGINVDDDLDGFIVTPTSGLVTTEAGGTAMYTIRLISQPTANVTIPISSSDTTEGVPTPTSLTFTPATWNTPRTVTVHGVDDTIHDGDQPYTIINHPAVSTDTGYSGLDPADVSVINRDDDLADIVVSPTSGLVTTEGGGTATFTIVLTQRPTGNVRVSLTSSDTTEGRVSTNGVTFTAGNWNQPQTVTITGVDDHVADGNQPYTIITGAAVSADPAYSGLNPPDVSVTNLDDETPQILVLGPPNPKTSESGRRTFIVLVMTVASTAPVTCPIVSSDTTEGTVTPGSATFTAGQRFQLVTVTGVDDTIVDGDQQYTVRIGPCASADPAYDGYDPGDVTVTNLDND